MSEEKGKGALILIGVPAALIASLFVVIILFLSGTGSAAAACTGGAGTVNPANIQANAVPGFSAEQLTNAAYIMNAAATLGLDRDGQVIGVMTAIGESSLTVINHGDTAGPDSRGLFQQRDSWGSLADRMDPTTSATLFFQGLQKVSNWQSLEPTLAAHKVQRNADPYHYEKFFAVADRIVTALAGGGGSCASGTVVLPLRPGFNMTSNFGLRGFVVDGASSWHPAVDLQHYPNPCGDQIYSITSGTVSYVGGYQVTIKSPDGYDVSYLHMKLSDVSVAEGDSVTPHEPIALVGSEGPSTGCHLDLRINKKGTINEAVAALKAGEDLGGPPSTYGYVNPEQFFALFGIELCPADSCHRQY